jgi:hypothetical protein
MLSNSDFAFAAQLKMNERTAPDSVARRASVRWQHESSR